ncbi:TPA: hypothetical protein IAA87_00750 [Candidatus Avigastranaerophilus faecigallinarum]|nr:hypothetical protein [Candidatus Avigastranaerophilus faecigallinarum]
MKQKIIALVDGNNFFASCEVLMNPSLKGKPVCVLSNNDGCVIARSYEAKKLGVKMGMPYFMAKKTFTGVNYLSADFSLYHELSQRMMKLISSYSDKVDIYSIDEAFLDITGLDKVLKLSFKEIAIKIKQDIESHIGVSVSVGIANSKVLAKLATHKAKNKNGIYVIDQNNIKNELQNIPVEEVWGVGKNIARSLRKYGIFYADEILLKDDNFYKVNYGKKGLELKYELMGISVIPLTGIEEKPKSIQRTRAFPEFSRNKRYIITELEMHLHNICKKLRMNNQKTSLIYVMLRTKDFRVFVKDKKLDVATDSEFILKKTVIGLFESIFDEEIVYRSSGIYAAELQDTEKVQLPLFEQISHKKGEEVSFVIDKIEGLYGRGSISLGYSGIKDIQEKHKRKMQFRPFS